MGFQPGSFYREPEPRKDNLPCSCSRRRDFRIPVTTMPHRRDAEILVVDDDPLTRQVLSATICASGFKCAEATSAAEAWEIVHQREIALLLLDYDMPGMNGAELLQRLR